MADLMQMIVHDHVYSDFTFTSPLAFELISTQAFQRLKGICQFGIPDKYYHLQGYSRYDHSMGVYILLNKLGAPEKEQIAGLLHDISHTAFSHLVDWVIGDSEQEDFQDKRHLSVLQQKEIVEILEKYNYSPQDIGDYHGLGLLERDLPDLCADRIDYVLRESSAEIIRECLPKMQVFAGEIVFADEESALLFANNFLDKQTHHWSGYEAMTRYVLLSDLLTRAVQEKIIKRNDFFENDDFVINKMIQSGGDEYTRVLKLMENKNLEFLNRSKTSVKKKFRYVDPKFFKGGQLQVLSEVNGEFKHNLQMAREINERGAFPGIIN